MRNTGKGNFFDELSVERQKVRRRYVWLTPAAILCFLLFWILWANRSLTLEELSQGYRALLFQLPLLNTILMPLMIAVISSRICDMEIKGNTLKLLCTVQNSSRIYHCKLLYSLKYLLGFCMGEVILIWISGKLFVFTEKLQLSLLLVHFGTTFAVGTCLMILQQTLSLLSTNQFLPLIVGLAGSFLGLFSIYFPEKISRYVLWSYFCTFTPIKMDWDKASRAVSYYLIPFDWRKFAGFLLFTFAFYLMGKSLFQRKEI